MRFNTLINYYPYLINDPDQQSYFSLVLAHKIQKNTLWKVLARITKNAQYLMAS